MEGGELELLYPVTGGSECSGFLEGVPGEFGVAFMGNAREKGMSQIMSFLLEGLLLRRGDVGDNDLVRGVG